MSKLRYIYVPRRTNVRHLYTFWVVTDLNDSTGRQLLREALEYIVSDFLYWFHIYNCALQAGRLFPLTFEHNRYDYNSGIERGRQNYCNC